MIKGVGHLGIVVRDIEKSLNALAKIVDFKPAVIKEFPDKKMKCAVVEMNGMAMEFLQDDSEDGFLGKYHRERGDAIHHFCLLSDDMDNDIETLKEKGVHMMDHEPRTGLRGKKIAFTAPDALGGISIELSEP